MILISWSTYHLVGVLRNEERGRAEEATGHITCVMIVNTCMRSVAPHSYSKNQGQITYVMIIKI